MKPRCVAHALAATTLAAALVQALGPPAASVVGSAFVLPACALVPVQRRGLASAVPARCSSRLEAIIEAVAGAFS